MFPSGWKNRLKRTYWVCHPKVAISRKGEWQCYFKYFMEFVSKCFTRHPLCHLNNKAYIPAPISLIQSPNPSHSHVVLHSWYCTSFMYHFIPCILRSLYSMMQCMNFWYHNYLLSVAVKLGLTKHCSKVCNETFHVCTRIIFSWLMQGYLPQDSNPSEIHPSRYP